MSTVEFIDHLTTIFFDLVLPALVLWIGWQIRKWLPAEVAAHQGLHDLTAELKGTQPTPQKK